MRPSDKPLCAWLSATRESLRSRADLGKYTDIDLFARLFPERFFQMGMAEQNLIGVAAGLARTGSCRLQLLIACSRHAGPMTSLR